MLNPTQWVTVLFTTAELTVTRGQEDCVEKKMQNKRSPDDTQSIAQYAVLPRVAQLVVRLVQESRTLEPVEKNDHRPPRNIALIFFGVFLLSCQAHR